MFEEKGESERIRTEVLLLTSLTARPNRLTVVLGFPVPNKPYGFCGR